MIESQERNDVQPRCPHCQKDLETVWYRVVRSLLGKRYLYFCSGCRAVLGVSHRKGFFMG